MISQFFSFWQKEKIIKRSEGNELLFKSFFIRGNLSSKVIFKNVTTYLMRCDTLYGFFRMMNLPVVIIYKDDVCPEVFLFINSSKHSEGFRGALIDLISHYNGMDV